MGPSKHLSWKELQCHDGTSYPKEFIIDGRVYKLADAFETIRRLCGDKPITVLSAYRTPTWNTKVGGAPKSQHLQGRALDLKPPEGWTVARFHKLIQEEAPPLEIRGIGLYKTFVHVDIRPGTFIKAWRSTMAKESNV